MALAGDITRLLFASFGLAKDVTVDFAKSYIRLIRRALGYSLVIGSVALAVFVASAAFHMPNLMAAGIVLLAVVVVGIILLSFPIVEMTAYAVELGVARRTLKLAGVISGWMLFVGLIAYSSPADSSLFTRVLVAGLSFVPAYLLFGREATLAVLGTKLAVVLAAMTFAVFLPRTNSMLSGFVAYLDGEVSTMFDPVKEIELSEYALETTKMFASDGAPLYWCRIAKERPAGYRCYNRPGRDRFNQEELRPISPEILDVIRTRLPLAVAPKAELQPKQMEGKAPAAQVPQGAAIEVRPLPSNAPVVSDFISPAAKTGAPLVGSPRWTIVSWRANGGMDGRLLQDIQTIASEAGLPRPVQVLRESFVSKGASRQVLQGDFSVLHDATLDKYTDYLMLAQYAETAQLDTEQDQLRSVTGALTVVLVRLSDTSISRSLRVEEGGSGADFDDAGERAYARLLQSAKPRLDSLMRGFVR